MTDTRFAPALVLVASIAILGGAFLFQYVGGLAPCVLCVYQRYPYGAAIALSTLALFAVKGRGCAVVLLLIGLVFVFNTGIAVFHVGVEQHWWEGTAACTGSVVSDMSGSIDALRAKILAAPVARCDRIPWSLFGLSLAGYNVLLSLALALFSLRAGLRALNRRMP